MSDECVYFIQADEDGPIKIGFTADDPKKRLNQLQTGNPAVLKLIGAVKGTIAREKELHAALAEWRLQGEWFQSHPTVLATIGDALAPATEPAGCGSPHCSFCEVCQHDTMLLIAGPDDIFICGQCVGLCAHIAAEHLEKRASIIEMGPLPEIMGYGG